MLYPVFVDRSLPEDLARLVADEAACATAISAVRWPEGFRCTRCGGERYCRLARRPRVFVCTRCKRHHSVTAGTSLQASHITLGQWLSIAWTLAAWPNTSCVLISCLLDMHYDTVWHVVHKLRAAVENLDRVLTGVVEAYPMPVCAATTKLVWRNPEKEPPAAPARVLVSEEGTGPGFGPIGFEMTDRPSETLAPDAQISQHRRVAELVTATILGRLGRVHSGVSYRWLPRYLRFYAFTMEVGVEGRPLYAGLLGRMIGSPHVRRADMVPP